MPMTTLYEQVVRRAFQYMNLSQESTDSATARRVLQIVDAELAHGEAGLLARVMDRLTEGNVCRGTEIPPAVPPIHRGSIRHT